MYDKTCPGCGNEFSTKYSWQIRCRRNCGQAESGHAARNKRRKDHIIKFIGVDGEGQNKYNPDGSYNRQDYVLLGVGDKSLYREDGEHLHYTEIFQFLYDCYEEEPTAAFVGFFLSYDFNMWLSTLPEDRAAMLFTKQGIKKRQRTSSGGNTVPFPVQVGEWEIDILGTKRFKLRPLTRRGKGKPWMYVCDAGSFFQASFLSVIDPKGWETPLVTDVEYRIISEGKSDRAAAILGPEMIRYNSMENDVLSRVMDTLNKGFNAMGIHLNKTQWMGPGQAAAAWLKNIEAPTGEQVRAAVPDAAMEMARKAYYGGWFEIFAHGHVEGTVYEYDINSAYPAVIANLPCLLHGDWRTGTTVPDVLPSGSIRIVHATVSGTDPRVGAMPHRRPNGTILRPSSTQGFYWQHELDAARAAGLVKKVVVHEWYQYDPCPCPPPMRSIEGLYQHRLSVGKNSPSGKAAKLTYNSSYGKMAQSVGVPRFSNAIYASLITAGCRTQILHAIATHPTKTKSLVMIATDGIYFTDPHPSLPLSATELGLWDVSEKKNLTLFMPGVYWSDKNREAIIHARDCTDETCDRSHAPGLKSRGINVNDLAAKIEEIDRMFDEGEWPVIDLSVKFSIVSCTQALARGKWHTAAKVSNDGNRKINSNPASKRDWDGEGMPASVNGLRRSRPYPMVLPDPCSTPYKHYFGDELREQEAEMNVTPDGTESDIFYRALSEV